MQEIAIEREIELSYRGGFSVKSISERFELQPYQVYKILRKRECTRPRGKPKGVGGLMERNQAILDLRRKGLSANAIAKEIGISLPAVKSALYRHGERPDAWLAKNRHRSTILEALRAGQCCRSVAKSLGVGVTVVTTVAKEEGIDYVELARDRARKRMQHPRQEEIVQLLKEGWTHPGIAKHLGVPRTTVSTISQRLFGPKPFNQYGSRIPLSIEERAHDLYMIGLNAEEVGSCLGISSCTVLTCVRKQGGEVRSAGFRKREETE